MWKSPEELSKNRCASKINWTSAQQNFQTCHFIYGRKQGYSEKGPLLLLWILKEQGRNHSQKQAQEALGKDKQEITEDFTLSRERHCLNYKFLKVHYTIIKYTYLLKRVFLLSSEVL